MKHSTYLLSLFVLLIWQLPAPAQVCFDYSVCGLYDFIVPTTGHMKVTVTGADGGDTFDAFGGSGGKVVAVFDALAGEVIRVIIGCPGNGSTTGGGGGGGTAVMKCGFNSANCNIGAATLLVAAGGGGGAGRCVNTELDEETGEEICSDLLIIEGGGAYFRSGSGFGGGVSGWANGGTGGGGVLSAGASNRSGSGGGQATFALISSGGIPFVGSAGGAGGPGFGGGGAGHDSFTGGGGGGGFSGGLAAYYEELGTGNGQGGTNFVSSTALSVQTNISGKDGGSGGDYSTGSVKIECISGAYGCDGLDIVLDGNELAFGTHTYRAERSLTANNWLDIGADVVFTAGETIRLTPGFRASSSSSLIARIVDCTVPDEAAAFVGDLPAESVLRADTLPQLRVFPNPVGEVVHYQLPDMEQIQRVLLFNMTGQLLKESRVISGQLALDGLAQGVYLLVLETTSGRWQQRLVKH